MVMLLFPQSVYAKKACKKYLEKLHNIQDKQRSGHSLKQSNKLKKQENQAREIWWSCENGKLAKNKSKTKAKNKKTPKKSQLKKLKKNTVAIAKKSKESSAATGFSITAPGKSSPFATDKAIVMKGEYQGQQLLDWLAFYQSPQKCQRPKNIKVFAACIEDKRKQQQVFEQGYHR